MVWGQLELEQLMVEVVVAEDEEVVGDGERKFARPNSATADGGPGPRW